MEGIDCFAAAAVDGLPIWVWRRFADVSAGALFSRDIEVWKNDTRRLEIKSLR